MSYLRETVKQAGYEVINYELEPAYDDRKAFHKLYLYHPKTNTYELWYESPNFAGYALTYGDTEFEFVSSWKPKPVKWNF